MKAGDKFFLNDATYESHSGISGLECVPAAGCEADIEEETPQIEESITTPFSPNDIKLSTPPMNLGDLIDRIQYGWINFGTDYQREEDLWSPRQQSRLIESVLLGLRLPAFYFEEVSKNKWNIIDGLQRCCSIRNFCVKKSLQLQDLEFLTQFKGKMFDDLPFEIVRDIRMLPITVNKLEPGVPDQVKYILFKRLNTGGIELTPQEIRNAVYQGRAIETITEMAKDSVFMDFIGYRIPNRRKQREDFVSRFVAFYLLGYENYEPDLEHFINVSMEQLRDSCSDEQIKKMERDFERSISFSESILGPEAFRKQATGDTRLKPLNKAYFEVITTTFALMSPEELDRLFNHREVFLENIHTSMLLPSYNYSFSGGTGLRDSVKRRHSYFRDIVAQSMEGTIITVTNDNRFEAE